MMCLHVCPLEPTHTDTDVSHINLLSCRIFVLLIKLVLTWPVVSSKSFKIRTFWDVICVFISSLFNVEFDLQSTEMDSYKCFSSKYILQWIYIIHEKDEKWSSQPTVMRKWNEVNGLHMCGVCVCVCVCI